MLRIFLILFVTLSRFLVLGEGHPYYPPDTIPPPPPGQAASLAGPSIACIGDTSVYTLDVPLGCLCEWTVDGEVQQNTTSVLSIDWSQTGNHLITVVSICGGGQSSGPQSQNVAVHKKPEVHLGNDTTLQQGQVLLLDAGNPGSNYLWSTGATSQTIFVTVSGIYSVEVSNYCGNDNDEIEVTILVGIPELPENELSFATEGQKLILLTIPGYFDRMELFDLMGKKIFDGKPQPEITLPYSGIYILKLISSEKIISKKFIIP